MQKVTDKKIKAFFKSADPKIYEVMKNMDFDKWRGYYSTDTDYFLRLTRSIIGQQLSTKAAGTIVERFYTLFPKGKVTPERLANIPDEKLRNVGMSWAKAGYIKDLAEKTNKGEIKFKKFKDMSDEQITEELLKIKGVGKWTTEMFLMFALGREDIFSPGDAGLMRGLKHVYGLIDKPTERQIKRITNKWKPYRSYGSYALWHSLD